MPSRNMIAANTSVFSSLDGYCASCAEPISNAGRPRWISTTSSGRQFLMNATLVAELSLSAVVKVARFDFSNRAVFVTSGLDVPEAPNALRVEDLDRSEEHTSELQSLRH